MAPTPKKKHTRSRSNKRRQVKLANFSHLAACPSCGKPRASHQVCKFCGYSYKSN